MTSPSKSAAYRRDGELENTALRPGFERTSSAAHPKFQFHDIRASLGADGVGGLTDSSPASFRRRKFVRAVTVARHLIPSLSFSFALQAAKQAARCCSKAFHVSNLSAGSTGLVARFERHEASERKIPNGGKSGARPGNLTARARNAY